MRTFARCSNWRAPRRRISRQTRKRSCGIHELRLRHPSGAARRTKDETGWREDSKNATSSPSATAAIWTLTFFTGANDPVEPECLPPPTAGRNPPPQRRRTATAVLCASLLGLGLAFFACTLLIPALRLDWSDVVCLGGNSNPPAADGTYGRVRRQAGTATAKPCRRLYAGTQNAIFQVIPRPALEHCSSSSPVTPLTPTPPATLPSTMIGTPPGEAKTPGRVAVATPPLLIASIKTRVVRR